MTDGQQLAREYAKTLLESLADVWGAIDSGQEIDGQDGWEHLEELPLELVWRVGEPFAVVLTTGGPHAEIVGGGRSGDYTLRVMWGLTVPTEHRADVVTRTGGYFRDLLEETAPGGVSL